MVTISSVERNEPLPLPRAVLSRYRETGARWIWAAVQVSLSLKGFNSAFGSISSVTAASWSTTPGDQEQWKTSSSGFTLPAGIRSHRLNDDQPAGAPPNAPGRSSLGRRTSGPAGRLGSILRAELSGHPRKPHRLAL